MPAERSQSGGPVLLRPLLAAPRQWLEDYAAAVGLSWVDDDSNDDTHFRRNFLRHEILPKLDGRFPGARQSLARAAGHFAECRVLLDDLAELDRAALTVPSGRIGLAGLKALSPSRARNLLRYLLTEAGFRGPDSRWIEQAINQLVTAGQGSETCLATADGELRVYRGELHVLPSQPPEKLEVVTWDAESAEVAWGWGRIHFQRVTGAGIRQDLLRQGAVRIQSRQGGERLRPDQKRPRRTLRNLLQESGVPPWERARLPCLWVGNQLVWVGGIGCEAAWQAIGDEPGVLPVYEL